MNRATARGAEMERGDMNISVLFFLFVFFPLLLLFHFGRAPLHNCQNGISVIIVALPATMFLTFFVHAVNGTVTVIRSVQFLFTEDCQSSPSIRG